LLLPDATIVPPFMFKVAEVPAPFAMPGVVSVPPSTTS